MNRVSLLAAALISLAATAFTPEMGSACTPAVGASVPACSPGALHVNYSVQCAMIYVQNSNGGSVGGGVPVLVVVNNTTKLFYTTDACGRVFVADPLYTNWQVFVGENYYPQIANFTGSFNGQYWYPVITQVPSGGGGGNPCSDPCASSDCPGYCDVCDVICSEDYAKPSPQQKRITTLN